MNPGRLLIIAGLVLVIVGLVVSAAPHIPLLGRLPGDIRIQRDGFRFYLPITTSILISVILSLILYVLSRIR